MMTDSDDDLENLTEELGGAYTGYELGTVLTALTYMVADACVQSELDEGMFLTHFNKHLMEAINELKDHDNGNSTHH